jgi:hypothetical protein
MRIDSGHKRRKKENEREKIGRKKETMIIS